MTEETWFGPAWVFLAYLVGSIPSTYLVARVRGAIEVLRLASRKASELDAHILLTAHAGPRWSGVAGVADVVKALLFALASGWVGFEPPWQAAAGVALVAGYCWPPYASRFAGRGLAVAAGVSLALLPLPTLVFGLLTLGGVALGATGLWSTIGLLSIPLTAWLLDAPGALVAMAAAILALILLRRIEGLGRAEGVPLARAALRRAVFDRTS
ncbi:MAG TPA: glycerol-3-phosphate acyltransferase [Actinomycetota bacterium]